MLVYMIISIWLFVVAGEEAKEEEGGMKPEILGSTPREMGLGKPSKGLRPWLSCLAPPFVREAGFRVWGHF